LFEKVQQGENLCRREVQTCMPTGCGCASVILELWRIKLHLFFFFVVRRCMLRMTRTLRGILLAERLRASTGAPARTMLAWNSLRVAHSTASSAFRWKRTLPDSPAKGRAGGVPLAEHTTADTLRLRRPADCSPALIEELPAGALLACAFGRINGAFIGTNSSCTRSRSSGFCGHYLSIVWWAALEMFGFSEAWNTSM
jgi:hypothetical protein